MGLRPQLDGDAIGRRVIVLEGQVVMGYSDFAVLREVEGEGRGPADEGVGGVWEGDDDGAGECGGVAAVGHRDHEGVLIGGRVIVDVV